MYINCYGWFVVFCDKLLLWWIDWRTHEKCQNLEKIPPLCSQMYFLEIEIVEFDPYYWCSWGTYVSHFFFYLSVLTTWSLNTMVDNLQTTFSNAHGMSLPKPVMTQFTGTYMSPGLNTLRPRQNGCQFPDDIFKCIFLNENIWIAIKIPLKFVPKVLINNIPALVQVMAWHRPGNKPLSESIMVSLPTHICHSASMS